MSKRVEVEAWQGRKVTSVVCGDHHTAVISDGGTLYTFGDASGTNSLVHVVKRCTYVAVYFVFWAQVRMASVCFAQLKCDRFVLGHAERAEVRTIAAQSHLVQCDEWWSAATADTKLLYGVTWAGILVWVIGVTCVLWLMCWYAVADVVHARGFGEMQCGRLLRECCREMRRSLRRRRRGSDDATAGLASAEHADARWNKEIASPGGRHSYLSLLLGSYRPGLWWWEFADIARKILLCGVFVYIRDQFGADQSAVPLVIAVVISILFAVVLGYCRPYADRNARVLVISLSANVVVVFIMLAGVVIKLRQGASTVADDDALGVLLACLLFAVPALVLVQALAEIRGAEAHPSTGRESSRKDSTAGLEDSSVNPIHRGSATEGARESSLRGASSKVTDTVTRGGHAVTVL